MTQWTDSVIFIEYFIGYKMSYVAPYEVHITMSPKIISLNFFSKYFTVCWFKFTKFPWLVNVNFEIVIVLNSLLEFVKGAIFYLYIFRIIVFRFVIGKNKPINSWIHFARKQPHINAFRQFAKIWNNVDN